MKKTVLIMTALSLMVITACNKTEERNDFIGFEELETGQDGYWNGSGGEGGFESGNAWFINHYNSDWDAWSGFSYSNHTDTETGDYTNMFSSIAGMGEDQSEKYSTFYFSGSPDTITLFEPEKITAISVSNSTYAYKTMLNGDLFAKKFGGEDGTDPDWFLLKLTTLGEDGNPVYTYNIYLADFRYEDNSMDYISNRWNIVDLSESGFITGIVFSIESSDTGEYGINTPAFVCIDNIRGKLMPLE